jgi:PAS domain S-box-containing protein
MPADFDKLVELTEQVLDQEKKQKQAKEELHKLMDTTTDGYWDWHIPSNYEYMSPRFWQIMGYDYTTKKHDPSEWMKVMHPDDLQKAKDGIADHFKNGGSKAFIQEVRYYRPDGSIVWILCKGRVIEWDSDGNPVRMVGTHSDITDLKEP